MVNIRESGPQLCESDIDTLEKVVGFPLPHSYRKFLIKNNGGRPSPDSIHIAGLPGSPTDIQEFLGLGMPIQSSDILWNWEICSGRIPRNSLPIACDSLGSLFCIPLSGSISSSIVFCLLTFDEDDGTTYFVANSFDEFLEMVVPFRSASDRN